VKSGEDTDNEVLVMLALQLHEKLGLMTGAGEDVRAGRGRQGCQPREVQVRRAVV